jgi:hypothetical protein
MLTEDEFKNWCRRLNMTELARKRIEVIRSSEPLSEFTRLLKKNASNRELSTQATNCFVKPSTSVLLMNRL